MQVGGLCMFGSSCSASMGKHGRALVGMAYTLVHFVGKMYDLPTACACVMVRGPCVGHHDRYEEEPNEPS